MLERDDAPMSTDVRDAGHPAQRGALERVSRGTVGRGVVDADAVQQGRRGLLVEEEDLGEDLRWDAAGRREGVAAGADSAQRASDGGHFAIDEVEGCGVCEGGGWDLL